MYVFFVSAQIDVFNPCACFYLNHCGCILQEKPARPPCGITTPGCISMTTPQRGSLPSLSRTSSTPCSPTPASSSCSGTRWKGRSNPCFHCRSALQCQLRYHSDKPAFVPPSYTARRQILSLCRKQRSCCHRRFVAF